MKPFRSLTLTQAKERSAKLDLPINLTSTIENKSFFTSRINTFANTFNILSTSLKEELPPKTFYKVNKIRLSLCKDQRKVIRQWFRESKNMYNKIATAITRKEYVKPIAFYELCEDFAKGINSITPNDIKRYACKEIVTVLKAHKTKKQSFKFHFKSTNKPSSIGLDIRDLKFNNDYLRMYPSKFKDKNIVIHNVKSREWLKRYLTSDNKHDCRLTHINGIFTLVIVISYEKKVNDITNSFTSLDPGVRTFNTSYNNNGISKEYGIDVSETLKKLDKRIDKSSNFKKHRLYKKKKDLVNELHYSVINDIVSTSSHVFIPKFNVSKMSRKTSNLYKQSRKDMLSLSHYLFRTRLIEKCTSNNVHVYVCNESYTSRTCGLCFEEHDIKSSKIFICKCGYTCDRDINAARNIMIKCIS